MIPQFCIGLLFSSGTSFLILERLRDRRLLCENKFDEKELLGHVYRQKIQDRIRIERSKEDSEQIRISKHVVNNEIVGKVKNGLNEAFKFSPIQYIKDLFKKE